MRRYINWIERSLDRDMFLSGPRCSSAEIDSDTKIEEKDNLTKELTQLALNSQPKNSNKSPHNTVEDFFLINDSTTVCTELPVFINPKEISLDIDEPITGHIDLVQIRYDNLYILDYKPNLNRPERHASQLLLYIRRALLEGKEESFDSCTRKRCKKELQYQKKTSTLRCSTNTHTTNSNKYL